MKLTLKTGLPVVVMTPVLLAQEVESVENDAVVVTESAIVTEQVTALKTGRSLKETPQSISVFSQEEIKEQGINSIADIVDYTPGVNNSQGEGHRDAVVFRGVRSTSDFYVDGIRDDVQYYRPLYNLEQVEILRGPNALFFGRGGTGGLINRSTKKPLFNETQTSVFGSVDSFGAFESQVDFNTSSDDEKAFRFNAHYDNLANHRDFFYGHQVGINPSFSYKLSDATLLNVSLEHINHERFIDRGIPTANGAPVDALNEIVFGDSEQNYSTLEANIIKVRLDHKFSDSWSASATASYSNFDKVYQNFYASDYDAASNQVTIDGYRDTTQRERFQFAFDILGKFETGAFSHTLAFGTEFISTSNDNDRYNTNFTPDFNSDSDTAIFDANSFALRNGVGVGVNGNLVNDFNTSVADTTKATVNAISFYLQDEIAITDRLDIVLGARFDSFDIDVKDQIGTDSGSQKNTNVAPRAGIVFNPIDPLILYASYSESFLPASGEQYANLGDQLDPDSAKNLEFGMRWDIKDALSLSVSAFQIDQSFTQDDGTGLQERVDGEISGFDAQLKGSVTDAWFISAGYSNLEGETSSGETPRELPEHSFSLWNNYQATDKLSLGLGFTYQSESLISDGGSDKLPSYTRFDAAASYKVSDAVKVQLNVENLFDSTYYPSAHSTHQVTVGAPLNAKLSVSAKF